jgi:diguanylate cyclase
MSEYSSEQEVKRWKQQYYDHLDLLDQKEKDWQVVETVLKKAVIRLSLAAEGQHASIDSRLQDIRSVVKDQVNAIRLGNILEDISALLLKVGGKKGTNRKVVNTLAQLLEEIDFPSAAGKQKKKIIKQLSSATDEISDELTAEVRDFLSTYINRDPAGASEKTKPGWLKNLFGADETADGSSSDSEADNDTDYDLAAQRVQPHTGVPKPGTAEISLAADENDPSIQEILIRLLEQLMVSPDLLEEVESLKRRIEDKSTEANWKQLLKDVAHLINTLRSRIQEEKQEFETFLQQITGRLKEMDSFLAIETASINEAEQAGDAFDVVVTAQVKDIHNDMTAANDLSDLKNKVEKRLNVVSDHIKQYRVNEQDRYASAQKNLEDMQTRMVMLEQEAGDLRKVILEKNREAMFDALTGIPNRLSYEKKAAEEIARCKRFASPLCMAVWDIDLFKQVNDTYGHKVGDKVLKVIAQLLNDRIRETDFIARYGGEEFVMFLPGTDESEALKLADALREKVAASKFRNYEDVIKITVSCGISSFVEKDSHETMFERADKALYAAKHNGRNQCMTFSSLADQ